ncbi:hypothetical protein P3T36_000558 [Kitasatospora sp. MAP12-15]|uniref:hypothetical protein n=1 Tax=unclassified Kitasatospora TaxID=2633591 RepID=UPI00247E718D|nr:hypothetical protein [Kitasatospora sp. MAP12-44]
MAVIAIVGGPGAPGATTTALALLLSWPLAPGRKVLLVECDPDGGAALAGALEGRVEAVYGLRNLAVADRRGLLAETLWDQLVDISPAGNGERLLLPGLTDPAQAAGLAYTWEPLVEVLHALEPRGYDVLLDLGRSGALGPGAVLARRADAVLATVRTTLRGLSSARPRLAALREDLESAGSGADALGLLLIAEGPYPAADVTRELGLPVLGQLPHAVRTAYVLSDGGDSTDRRFIRSELMRTARSAADQIQELVQRRRARIAATGATAVPAAVPAAEPQHAHHAQPPQPVQQELPQPGSWPGGQPYAAPSGQLYAPGPEQATGYDGQAYAQPYSQPYVQQSYPQPPYGEQLYVPPSAPQPAPAQPAEPYPPLAGIAPHPAAPEQFRAPQDEPQTQGAVLRAR